jgi:amino acid adenylation domain-containing protein
MMQAIGQRLLHWARTQPDQLAVDDGILQYTYKSLAQRALGVAQQLESQGVSTGDRVCILLPKGCEAVAAIIGTLMSGASYIPLDINSPRNRLNAILEDSQAKIIISNIDTSMQLDTILQADEFIVDIADCPIITDLNKPLNEFDYNLDAYVLYTSGSTGQPNGVRISHTAMYAFFSAMNSAMGISRHSRCMNTSALYFDVSIADLFLPLYQGASVWLGPNVPLPFRYYEILNKYKVTHFCAVGSTLNMLSSIPGFEDNCWEHLTCMMTGAEVLNPHTIAKWLAVAPNVNIINGYGPTEATCVCTYYEINHANIQTSESFPIGKPLPNITIHLDREKAQGDDDWGELCVSGPQIMNGYLNHESLNEQRMFEHQGQQYYRTGDKVKFNEEGDLLFIGRIDDQVKVNGYRVHLGEVTEPFRNHSEIQDAVALTLKHPQNGECLAVVVKTENAGVDLSLVQIQANLALPKYMQVALVATIDEFPKSPSGKVNAKRVRELARQHFSQVNTAISKLPATQTQKTQVC